MLTKQLTCKTYLKSCYETKIVARLDSDTGTNALITEPGETLKGMYGEDIKLNADRHYLVGEIADRLYAYEQLGYSPEELKVIIAKHNAQKLTLNSIYGGRHNGKTEIQRQIYDYICSDIESTRALTLHYNPSTIVGAVTECKRRGDGLSARVTFVDKPHAVKNHDPFEIKDVIFNDPATIIFWEDGTKTVVKATDEAFDPEKGLAMAIVKKAYGNKGNYFNKIKKWTKKYAVFNLRGMIERLNEKRNRDQLAKSYTILNGAYTDRKATKSDLGITIEEAIGLLGQVLND